MPIRTPAPMTFALHQRLQQMLCVTAQAWGLNARPCGGMRRAPTFGFAISY
ncbi:hypothetical protein ACDW_23290 [Acidovorax sp. DW039]|uniref:hypothetical protein n=1 Tax=Acidovorax sp. DW039 TaxID=3095606 RepID=UPI00308BD948|nr:hypothetical protein ACDW_23290 [Acidovorax sp. DW039]